MLATYNDKDGLEDGTSLIPPQVRVTKEGTKEREKIDRSCHLLTLLAALALSWPNTLVKNKTKFTPTPKNANVAIPWFTG